MPYEVLLTQGAERDIEEIYVYIAEFESQASADRLLDRLLATARSLAMAPQRGSHPRELEVLGIREYRQVFFKPYRLIYRVVRKQVFISVIADGRRDMRTLLARRLLSS
jgi:toxin ParE1/3/4